MGKVRVHDSNGEGWRVIRSLMQPEQLCHFDEPYLDSTIFMHEAGARDGLQLSEQKYRPGVSIDLHAHETDEIFYILAGEMRLAGGRVLGPGQSLFVGRDTLYAFEVGDKGLHFLAFRPRADMSYVTREEFERRRTGMSSDSPGASEST